LWSEFFIIFLAASIPFAAIAEPVLEGIPLPPASFTIVEDKSLLDDIGISDGPVWCYDIAANSIIITAPARERAHCELKLLHESEKVRVKHDFEIKKLSLRVETLLAQHSEINLIKDNEIDRLTEAALNRPNDNSFWWCAGGFTAGVATTILVGWLVASLQEDPQ